MSVRISKHPFSLYIVYRTIVMLIRRGWGGVGLLAGRKVTGKGTGKFGITIA